ncbi:bifunctional 3'-5' exonuclease/DNA polymerase [Labedaea rhizosphaerae]|uniref:DNA-directed DNA polymerase n=1 Tax=Labedaea rhizosphaerae TaxID=598644 RepID=A0A4R6SDV1_LABRH|nr:bifunctional 3'-5' exonuclease/DNA polymerase [Labedaea rhizosphaerae]TDP97867.1 DNA polymerase-1 [Labedaea rhizosphaerae]
MRGVLVVVAPEANGVGRVRVVGEPGDLTVRLAEWMAETERNHRPRWVLPSAAEVYPGLLKAGARIERCHDLTLAEGILLGFAGEHHRPRNPVAAWARAHGGPSSPEPPDPPPPERDEPPALFEADRRPAIAGLDPLDCAEAVYADQQRRTDQTAHPDRLRLLIAAESAGGLAGAEMTHFGLPWRADVHEQLLTDLLGPRPPSGARPKVLQELAEEIGAAFGGITLNPDHPPSVVRAFQRVGIDVSSSRAWELKQVDHPAVAPLLHYKELSRLYVAHGWSWLHSWVHNGRFRPEYVVGGVVSGRWATRGGAALQLPRALRTAVRADPGWTLVVADAAQLEPRVLAALSADRKLAEVAGSTDLYAGLAEDAFGGDRGQAKIAMLSAMYGGTSGGAGPLLAVLRKRFPEAVGYVEEAARTGERGGIVRSRLGRTSPAPGEARRELMESESGDETVERRARQAAREWGRFTRNFVVQASAADWASTLLATLRRRLAATAPAAELVFFQHDEVLVHCPADQAETVAAEVTASAQEASDLVFPGTAVRFPLQANIVDCYADAK